MNFSLDLKSVQHMFNAVGPNDVMMDVGLDA
jgi:hypothetical protein